MCSFTQIARQLWSVMKLNVLVLVTAAFGAKDDAMGTGIESLTLLSFLLLLSLGGHFNEEIQGLVFCIYTY